MKPLGYIIFKWKIYLFIWIGTHNCLPRHNASTIETDTWRSRNHKSLVRVLDPMFLRILWAISFRSYFERLDRSVIEEVSQFVGLIRRAFLHNSIVKLLLRDVGVCFKHFGESRFVDPDITGIALVSTVVFLAACEYSTFSLENYLLSRRVCYRKAFLR